MNVGPTARVDTLNQSSFP